MDFKTIPGITQGGQSSPSNTPAPDDALLNEALSAYDAYMGLQAPNLSSAGYVQANNQRSASAAPYINEIIGIARGLAQSQSNTQPAIDAARKFLAQKYGGFEQVNTDVANAQALAKDARTQSISDSSNRYRTAEGTIDPAVLAAANTASRPAQVAAQVMTESRQQALGDIGDQLAAGLQTYRDQLTGGQLLQQALGLGIDEANTQFANQFSTQDALNQVALQNFQNQAALTEGKFSVASDLLGSNTPDTGDSQSLYSANLKAFEPFGTSNMYNPTIATTTASARYPSLSKLTEIGQATGNKALINIVAKLQPTDGGFMKVSQLTPEERTILDNTIRENPEILVDLNERYNEMTKAVLDQQALGNIDANTASTLIGFLNTSKAQVTSRDVSVGQNPLEQFAKTEKTTVESLMKEMRKNANYSATVDGQNLSLGTFQTKVPNDILDLFRQQTGFEDFYISGADTINGVPYTIFTINDVNSKKEVGFAEKAANFWSGYTNVKN